MELGFQTALDLSYYGFDVIVHGRTESKAKDKAQAISNLTKQNVDFTYADLSKFGEISSMCKRLSEKYTELNVLILNAGIYHPKNKEIEYIECRINICSESFGKFLYCERIIPNLKKIILQDHQCFFYSTQQWKI